MRVLVVDDVPTVCGVIADMFQRHGHEAYACVDSSQALVFVSRLRPDVLLLDIEMPEVSGLEIARELRNHPLRPRTLVAVTGYDDPIRRKKIVEAGFDHHLVKPVDWSQLAAVLPSVGSQ